MRNKAVFSVFGRKLPSGKRVYYYQYYDQKGKRQWAKSTGLSKKTEAVSFCMKLFRDGLLIPEQKAPTFAEFSAGWWEAETCKYIKWRQLHNPMGIDTISLHKGRFENHIKDYFARFRLDDITPNVVEGWLLYMSEKYANEKDIEEGVLNDEKEKTGRKKLKAQTINLAFRTFKLMTAEAVRLKLIKDNPCNDVKELKADKVNRDILTVDEVRKLFPVKWDMVWESDLMYKLNRLAACTGMRIGELVGLRGEYVFDDYLYITGQYTRHGYVTHTKTKENRNIPITALMREELETLLEINGNGYVFSEDGGETPVNGNRVRDHFDRALSRIGINADERKKRKLTFHSWRHFLNTLLLTSNVVISKVQKVTGHKTFQMTEHYTHFDTKQFSEVRNVQAELLTYKKPADKNATVKRTVAKKKNRV